MPSPMRSLSLAALLAFLFLPGCSNTLNPFCGSARPAPLIGALSPSSLTFAQVQQGVTLVIKGSQFVAASVVVLDGKPLATSVVNSQQLKVLLNGSVVSGPGHLNVAVQTPSGNSADLGCSSGGKSSVLVLTVN